MSVDWQTLLEQLTQPFPGSTIQWRAGAKSNNKKRAQALAYAEPRVYEDRLNEVCPGDWSCQFKPWGENRIICELTIHGVKRSSTGEPGDSPAKVAGTSSEAQAFKRACSKFGLGRYLYDLPDTWVDYDQAKGRLLETPTLPKKFLPADTQQTKAEPNQPLLNLERAEAMAVELEKLGVTKAAQLKFVSEVLGQRVRAFTQLNEAEALQVWAVAKKQYKEAA